MSVKAARLAVTNSARFVPNIPAFQQGNGIVDVGAAFDLLKAYAAHPPTIEIVSRGPVRTPYSGELATPNQGVSLYELQGWHSGDRGTRLITLMRTTGPKELMTFALSWLGNEAATFTAPTSVTLPLNQPVPLVIEVTPKTVGVHSALLTLDHPTVPGHVYRLMTTIVANEPFMAAQQYTISHNDTLERPGPAYGYYLDISTGAAALIKEVHGEGGLLGQFPGEDGTSFVPEPEAGTREILVGLKNDGLDLRWNSTGARVDPPLSAHVTARLLGAETKLTSAVPSLKPDQSTTFDVEVQNHFGPFTGSIVPSALGSARLTRGRLGPPEQRMIDITVPAGARMLEVALTSAMPSTGGLSFYVFDCTQGSCKHPGDIAAYRVFRQRQPHAGQWRIVLDAAAAPATGAEFELRDLILDPAIGGVTTTDVAREHGVGDRWQAKLNAWMATTPPAGRDPYLAIITEATIPAAGQVPVSLLLVPLTASAR